MALIRTIAQVHATKLRVSNLDEDATLPDMDEAQRLYILPYIGAALIAELETTIDGIDGAETPENLPYRTLLPYVQKPLAAFAYWAELPVMHSRITEAGVRRTTTDNMPAAYKWEYEEAHSYLEDRAYSTLEALLVYLEANAETFADTYGASDQKQDREKQLIKSGEEFTTLYKLFQPSRTYHHLKPLLQDVELMYIAPAIGAEFYDELKALASPSALETKAINLLKLAMANISIYLATEKLPCRISANGFDVLNSMGNNTSERAQAAETMLSKVGQAAKLFGEKYLNQCLSVLNENATAEVFTTFFESKFYTAPGNKIIDRKNDSRKIFRF
jgi:hypothetical protein